MSLPRSERHRSLLDGLAAPDLDFQVTRLRKRTRSSTADSATAHGPRP